MELQKCIRDIFASEESRKQFESNPEGNLSRYQLTSQEKNAFMTVYSGMGLVTSDSAQMTAAIKAHYNWLSSPVQ